MKKLQVFERQMPSLVYTFSVFLLLSEKQVEIKTDVMCTLGNGWAGSWWPCPKALTICSSWAACVSPGRCDGQVGFSQPGGYIQMITVFCLMPEIPVPRPEFPLYKTPGDSPGLQDVVDWRGEWPHESRDWNLVGLAAPLLILRS